MAAAIPFAFDDYLELVDSTGRVIREDKLGYIPGETPRLLERLAIAPEQFVATAGRLAPSGSDQGKALIIIENGSNFSAEKLLETHF